MNKKQSEHIEAKFREAAENFHPPVNPKGWEKMEALLDRADDRRRPAAIWWYGLLVLLLTGGIGTYFYMSKLHSPVVKNSNAVDEKLNSRQSVNPRVVDPFITSKAKESVRQGEPDKIKQRNTGTIVQEPAAGSVGIIARHGTAGSDSRNNPRIKPIAPKKVVNPLMEPKPYKFTDNDLSTAADLRTIDEQKRKAGNYKPGTQASRLVDEKATNKDDVAANRVQQAAPVVAPQVNDGDKNKVVAKVGTVQNKQPAKVQQPLAEDSETKSSNQQIPVNSFASRFYVTAAIASDGNAVKGSPIKQVSAMYGIGLGYQVNKRFSIQTGLYAGRKRYAADSNNYFLKPGYWRMVKIRTIDADCFVFNMPLSVRYNIIPGRRGQLYGVAGISSYFMQKEAYDYYYTYPNSNSIQFRRELFGNNNHLFSVADFSIGYEHRLSRHLSIQGEPYYKLPLNGVGEGKVHLYSAGLMFGLKYRP